MLSVLIPVYNYSIQKLVTSLLLQAKELECPYEILVFDDFSTDNNSSSANRDFCKENGIQYFFSHINLGNAQARNQLALKAQYKWFLFIDADMYPVFATFIREYVEAIKRYPEIKVFSGEIVYNKKFAERNKTLRWKYGVKYEELSVEERDKNKYLNVKSANLLVNREVFEKVKFSVLQNKYGFEDTYFGLQLQKLGVEVKMIENPLYHEGLDTNDVYLNKVESSVENLVFIAKNKDVAISEFTLIRFHSKIKKTRLDKLLFLIYKKNKLRIKKNLLSEQPNIYLLQFYKLGYFMELLAKE